MKKKALAVLCTGLVLAVSLCACTKKVDEPASEVLSSVAVTSEEEPSSVAAPMEEATFTEIVNGLKAGDAYAVEVINGVDVLFVTDYTFEDEGSNRAIGADLYIYENGAPKTIGHVEAGGTAYPLGITDGVLYVGRNHAITAYVVADGALVARESIEELFDEDGNVSYTYTPGEGGEGSNFAAEDVKAMMSDMYKDYNEGEIIAFDVVAE